MQFPVAVIADTDAIDRRSIPPFHAIHCTGWGALEEISRDRHPTRLHRSCAIDIQTIAFKIVTGDRKAVGAVVNNGRAVDAFQQVAYHGAAEHRGKTQDTPGPSFGNVPNPLEI